MRSMAASYNSQSSIKALFSGLVAVFFWGLSFVSTKVIMEDGGMSPTQAYICRFIVAYLVLVCISHKRWRCRNLHDELMLLVCGITGGSIYFITENTALQLTLTSNVSLLTSTSPLLTILLIAVIYRNQRPGKGTVIGSLIAFAGVLCVILNSLNSQAEFAINPIGDLLALSSALCWSIYTLVLKRVNVTYDALFITRKTFFYGVLTALPFMLIEPTQASVAEAFSKPIVVANVIFLALGASIASYYLWAVTVDRMGAIKANNLLYFQPIVTLIASAIILHEPITLFGIIGFVLILFGIWFGDHLQKLKR